MGKRIENSLTYSSNSLRIGSSYFAKTSLSSATDSVVTSSCTLVINAVYKYEDH